VTACLAFVFIITGVLVRGLDEPSKADARMASIYVLTSSIAVVQVGIQALVDVFA
jgi:hypothetical protein